MKTINVLNDFNLNFLNCLGVVTKKQKLLLVKLIYRYF